MVIYSADSSRRRYITEEIKKMGKGTITAEIFAFRELSNATKNFNPENLLGEGGFGRVYKGQIERTKKVLPHYNSHFFHCFLSSEKKSV